MKTTVTMLTYSPEETQELGQRLAARLKPGNIVCLFGDLGSGKTTFVKGLARGMGLDPRQVHSPTFVLLNIYEGKRTLYHFDFYRLEHPEDIAAIGYDDFLYGTGISVVEWSERFGVLLPQEFLRLDFQVQGKDRRRIVLSAGQDPYIRVLEALNSCKKRKPVPGPNGQRPV